MNDFTFHWHGLACLEIAVNRKLQPTLFRQLALAARLLSESDVVDGATSSYGSLAAYWQTPPNDPDEAADTVAGKLSECLRIDVNDLKVNATQHVADIQYNGPDLNDVAAHCQCDPADVVQRHTSIEYTVAAIGFLPHFGYLWGMDSAIASPRRESPRTRVPAGAIGIAGEQTGIYPQESPGGWQLIGQVEPSQCRELCPRLRVGDTVLFRELT